MKKRWLTGFLCVLLIIGLMPVGASAKVQDFSAKEADFSGYESVANENTILGVDATTYQQQVKWEKQYKDLKGKDVDVFSFLKANGVNTITVKVAVNPSEKDWYLSLDNQMKTLKAAKTAGLKTNLVLLYSDAMTYKNTQNLPAGWENEEEKSRTDQAVDYTTDTLNKLKQAGLTPDIVTIGNEVDWNFLGYSGNEVGWKAWEAYGKISQAVKEACPDTKVALSFAAPNAADGIQWYFDSDKLHNAWYNIQYDYVGLNIYEEDAAYVETDTETFAQKEDNAQLIISSVTYANTAEDDSASVQTQADNLYHILAATISDSNAGGVIYDKGLDCGDWHAFFDEYGHAYNSVAVFGIAKGDSIDTTCDFDPFQYGGEPGLKSQSVKISKISGMNDTTMRGVDASSYVALKNAGVKFYDFDGTEKPLMQILSENGVNYLRIRIWNDPKNANGETYGGGNNDVEVGLELAKEAKKYNMKVLLCYHYSDFWAAPAQQILPKAWEKDAGDASAMAKHYYNFTKKSLQQFVDTGADIGMVQVGNEITNGIPGAYKSSSESAIKFWSNKTKSQKADRYLKAGIKAVREVSPNTLVALHLESPDLEKYDCIMKDWKRDGVDYDVLGSSYYPFWSVKQKLNTPENLTKIQSLAASYGKLFAVLETSWTHTLFDSDGMYNRISNKSSLYDSTPQGQVDELTDTYKVLGAKSNGLGAFYWEPAWIPVHAGWIHWKENDDAADELGTGWAGKGAVGYFNNNKMYYEGEPAWGGSSWENQALFDMNGYALQSLKFYKDSVSGGKTQTTVLKLVDQNGKSIATNRFAKVAVGTTKTVTLPEIAGYSRSSLKLSVKGSKAGVVTKTVTYKELPKVKTSKIHAAKISAKTYTGYAKRPTLTLTYGGKKLKKNFDYSVSYANNIKVGTAKAIITGKGRFVGKKTVTFQIKKRTSFAPGIYKMKTKASIHSTRSLRKDRIATYKKGKKIEVVKVYKKNKSGYRWLKITYGKKYAYVYSKYVSLN